MPSTGCSRTRAERSTLPRNKLSTRRVYHENPYLQEATEIIRADDGEG
nr:MAG TPA: hypothetical protein [Bacteriophage sp.]